MRSAIFAAATALLLTACAGSTLQTSSQTFDLGGAAVTVRFINSLSGCFPTAGQIRNNRDAPLNYVYVQVFAATQAGQTVGSWSVNFPPTIPGGSADAAAITGGGGATLPCEQLRLYAKA